jgi:hypothetical protein
MSGFAGFPSKRPSALTRVNLASAMAGILDIISKIPAEYAGFSATNDHSTAGIFRSYGSTQAATAFGITLADYVGLFSQGANSNGLLVGTIPDKPVIFGVNNVEVGRWNSAGLTVKKLLDLSTSTAGQIKFPATQNASSDANTFDDYKEQTTTPTPTAGTGALTSASSTVYTTKAGREVHVDAVILLVNGTGGSQDIRITVPYSAVQAAPVHGYDISNSVALTGYISGSTLFIKTYSGAYPSNGTHTVSCDFTV